MFGVWRGPDIGFSLCAAPTYYTIFKYFKLDSEFRVQRLVLDMSIASIELSVQSKSKARGLEFYLEFRVDDMNHCS